MFPEAVANQRVDTLEELEELLSEGCRQPTADPELIRSSTLFRCWPLDYASFGSTNGDVM